MYSFEQRFGSAVIQPSSSISKARPIFFSKFFGRKLKFCRRFRSVTDTNEINNRTEEQPSYTVTVSALIVPEFGEPRTHRYDKIKPVESKKLKICLIN